MVDEKSPAPAGGIRHGEVRVEGPEPTYGDAGLVFIGQIRSPVTQRRDCPKNLRQAREAGIGGHVELAQRYRPALASLSQGGWVFLITFLERAERDLALQMPRHAETARGTFSLRSPVRPNPIGLHLVRITALDAQDGIIEVDAIDVLDRTPLLDIKPYLPSVDAPPAEYPAQR